VGRFVLTVVVLLAITALVVATWANWRRDGKASFRVFDPVWWGVGRSEAQPYVDGAHTAAERAYESLWGAGGLVDQAETWIKERKAAPPPAAGTSAAAHEAAFAEAESRFEDGVVAYKRAKPAAGKATDRAAVREAITAFTACRDLLAAHLDDYAKLPDRRPAEQAKAEDLQRLNARFLDQARRLAEIR
jgi:hypothetical protein